METEGGVSALLRPSRVGVRVVGAINWPPTASDADSIQPRLDVAARPHAPTCVLGIALDRVEFSLRIFRPVNCETVAHQPFAEIGAVHQTRRHGSPVLVKGDRDAAHRPSGNEGIEIVRRLRSAAILQAVIAPTELTAFRSVDAPQPDACTVYFQDVAVDDAGLTR
jgi:hypothetical protein